MTSLLLEKLRILNFDTVKRLHQYKSHYTYVGERFKCDKLLKMIASSQFSEYKPILEEYATTFVETLMFSFLLYFSLSLLSYFLFFKWRRDTYLPNYQGKLELWNDIKWSIINITVGSFPVSALRMTLPRFSLIYYDVNDFGYLYLFISIFLHISFDETLTYWLHRVLHTNRTLYKWLHKVHHDIHDVSPFTSYAFHPLDAFLQALPTFMSCYFFPLHYDILLFFSIVTMIWSISIHDNVPVMPIKLFLYSTHHTIHHERGLGQFKNYGKFLTIWDRLAGTYSDPDKIDYGWKRNEESLRFYKTINNFIDKYVPDKTPIRRKKIIAKDN